MKLERWGAFAEYVLRPLSEDWRIILEKVRELDLPITPDLIQRTAIAIGLWHVIGEIIRAASYVAVTWVICQAVVQVWPLL
jgi:hypothetical protein